MAKQYVQISLSKARVADLRRKQSVRTTFRLPERSIMALSILSAQLGIKQKTLFDHLGEDLEALQACAREAEARSRQNTGVAKTYVVSRRTLENFEHVAANCNASRDALVISSIERIMPLLAQEQERHELRKKILVETEEWVEQGHALLQRSRSRLGDDDPAVEELAFMLRGAQRAFTTIENMVEKGKRIEKFSPLSSTENPR